MLTRPRKIPGDKPELAAAGFTLLELTSVVAIITVLVSLLCAALNHTKAKALRVTCLDNVKQLQVGWAMYVDDYNQQLPLNQTAPAPKHHRIPANRSSTNSWVTGNPKEDIATSSITRGTLYPYVRSVLSYHCPMDDSTVMGHPDELRTRSYSMNGFLGGDNAGLDPRVKSSYDQLSNPRPENTFVFIEEHQDSIWTSSFLVIPRDSVLATTAGWASTPADRHYQGCNISFADGHVEYWKWYSPKKGGPSSKMSATARDLSDIRRLQATVPQP